jgi:hypothetical protein
MATGRIIYVKQNADGAVHGYVADDAIKNLDTSLRVYFDSRCFEASAEIEQGARVEFQYDLSDRTSIVPRMKFDSMKLREDI